MRPLVHPGGDRVDPLIAEVVETNLGPCTIGWEPSAGHNFIYRGGDDPDLHTDAIVPGDRFGACAVWGGPNLGFRVVRMGDGPATSVTPETWGQIKKTHSEP